MEYNADRNYCKLPDGKIYIISYVLESPFDKGPSKIEFDTLLENGNIDESGKFNGIYDICQNLSSDKKFIINNGIFYLDDLEDRIFFKKNHIYEAYKGDKFYGFAECTGIFDVLCFKVTHTIDKHSKLITTYYPKVDLYKFSKTGVLYLDDEVYINFTILLRHINE